MAEPTPILQRLQAHPGRIQRMLTPGLKNPGGRMPHLSAVLPRFGGAKYKQGLSQVRILDKYRLGNLRPDLINQLGKTLPAQLKNPGSLLHLKPATHADSKLWAEVERIYPTQQSGSETEASPESGILRAGSIIQKFQTVPKLGQDLESFKQQTQSRPIAPGSTSSSGKPRKPVSRPSNTRPYSRVEEVTGRKREQADTTEERPIVPAQSVDLSSLTESSKEQPISPAQAVDATSQAGQIKEQTKPPIPQADQPKELKKTESNISTSSPAVSATQGSTPTIQRQLEQPDESMVRPSTSLPFVTPKDAVPQESEKLTPPPQNEIVTPKISAGPETQDTQRDMPLALPASPADEISSSENDEPVSKKPLLKAVATPQKSVTLPVKSVLKATRGLVNKTSNQQTEHKNIPMAQPSKATTRPVGMKASVPPVQRMPETPANKSEADSALIQSSEDYSALPTNITQLPTPAKIKDAPKFDAPRERVEKPASISDSGPTQKTSKPEESPRELKRDRETRARDIVRSVSPQSPEPLQEHLAYRKLTPVKVRSVEANHVKPMKAPQPLLMHNFNTPVTRSTKPNLTMPELPVMQLAKHMQPESPERTAKSTADTPFSEQSPWSLVSQPSLPVSAASLAKGGAASQASTGMVQRVIDSTPSLNENEQTSLANTKASTSATPDLDELAESLMPLVKRILETEAERTSGWSRSIHP